MFYLSKNSRLCSHVETVCFDSRIRLVQRVVRKPDAVQRERQRVQRFLPFRGLQLALPHGDAVPAHLRQELLFLRVALLIPPDFRHPKFSVRLRNLATLGIFNRKL